MTTIPCNKCVVYLDDLLVHSPDFKGPFSWRGMPLWAHKYHPTPQNSCWAGAVCVCLRNLYWPQRPNWTLLCPITAIPGMGPHQAGPYL
jgi:hypothetical protein